MTYLSDDLYQTIVKNTPLVCVDLIPVKHIGNEWQIGIITRATGPEANKPALLGGRIWYGETINDAIARHILTDWNVTKYQLDKANNEAHPFYVQQYLHKASAKPPFGYDPTKQAISLTYLIKLSEEPEAQNEASKFYWIKEHGIPKTSAYNHHLVMKLAFAKLKES